MKKYISLSALVLLNVPFAIAEDTIEKAIREVRPGELRAIFSYNVVLRASDKEKYVKFAREIVEALKQVGITGKESENPLVEDILQQQEEIDRAGLILGASAGGLLGALMGGGLVGLVLVKNPWLKFASLLIGSSGLLGLYWVLLGLTKAAGNEGVYFRAHAVLKILEDVPVAKE
jgi:hypothetical protein